MTTELTALRRLVEAAGGVRFAAAQLGVSPSTLSLWLSGKRQIDLRDARRILDLGGERWAALDEPQQRARA